MPKQRPGLLSLANVFGEQVIRVTDTGEEAARGCLHGG